MLLVTHTARDQISLALIMINNDDDVIFLSARSDREKLCPLSISVSYSADKDTETAVKRCCNVDMTIHTRDEGL